MATCEHYHTTMYMYIHVYMYRCNNYAAMDTHSNFTMMTAQIMQQGQRTTGQHQSASEERHTIELYNYIAAPRLYFSTLYIVDTYMYLHTCKEVTRLVAMFSISLTVTVFWQESLQRT